MAPPKNDNLDIPLQENNKGRRSSLMNVVESEGPIKNQLSLHELLKQDE